jgi:dTMP kinase
MFITFEGIEGCGKTTQVKLLAEELLRQGRQVTLTREPGGCAIADKIRAILLDADHAAMTPLTELLLYAAARNQHLNDTVRPALEAGVIVLCDRFTDATIAYQGYGRGLDLDLIGRLNVLATNGLAPGLTILMDCPVEVGLCRALSRINGMHGAKEERFERESLRFHESVRAGYLALAQGEPDRFAIVNANRPVSEIASEVAGIVTARLQRSDHGV